MKRYKLLLFVCAALVLGACTNKETKQKTDEPKLIIEEQKTDSVKTENVSNIQLSNPSEIPQFPGGFEAMRSYIKNNIRMPEAAKKMKKEGQVIVNAHVSTNGKITDCEIFSSDDEVFNDEALRVVKSMPVFTPAHKDGQAVESECKIAVMFRQSK